MQESTKYWFYEGRIKAVKIVVMEAAGIDEFYIESKRYDWLLCFDHHDIVTGTGEYIEERLRK